MKRSCLILLRVGVLFGLSGIMVGGFWFHVEFYKLGLPLLFLVGGVAIPLLILAFWLTFAGDSVILRKPRKAIGLRPDDIQKIKQGTKRMIMRKPGGEISFRPGEIIAGNLEGENEGIVCRLQIVGVDRKYMDDFEQEDLTAMGIESREEFSKSWNDVVGRSKKAAFAELIWFNVLRGEKG